MSNEIIVRPEAAREVQEAFDWYEEKSEGLGPRVLASGGCLSSRYQKESARFSRNVSRSSPGIVEKVPLRALLHRQ